MCKAYHHFDVMKNGDEYRIVVEGIKADAEEELKKTFGFDMIRFVSTNSARWKDMHGNRRLGTCTVRGFWQKNKRGRRDGRA